VPLDGELRARAIRRAILRTDRLLAAVLAEWSDENLPELTEVPAANCWKPRVMGRPREDRWVQDAAAISARLGLPLRATPRLPLPRRGGNVVSAERCRSAVRVL
jgi:hypothetical protein